MEKTKNVSNMKDFLVIGIGRFGKSVATELFSNGKEVLAIDKLASNVSDLEGKVSSAVVADATSRDILYSLGAQNFDCAIICIGEELESSLLAVQTCKELGINYIIAKAKSDQHSQILYALGVDLVIFPESFAGKKLATMLTSPGIKELVDLTNDFKIFEMPTPEVWQNKTLREINMPKKYKVSLVILRRNNDVLSPDPDMTLVSGDFLVLAGLTNKINSLLSLIKGQDEDINNSLKDVFGNK